MNGDNLFGCRGEEKTGLNVKGTYYYYEKNINSAIYNFIYICYAGSAKRF